MAIPLKTKMLLLVSLLVSSSLLTQTYAETVSKEVIVMSLNLYGWKTMPEHSDDYAQLIKHHGIDILGIQEGADDWQLKGSNIDNNGLPTNYQRAITLSKSLGKCWQHKFQIYINHCQGNSFIDSGRFDLTDGPNATRTGEYAVIEKLSQRYLFVNVHWDHESTITRIANANETSDLVNKISKYPKILIGDFNTQCDDKEVLIVQNRSKMVLLKNAGIDCLFVKGLKGNVKKIAAYPSDHPAIIATLSIE